MAYTSGGPTADKRAWTKVLARYCEPSRLRSVVELIITAVPFGMLWALSWAAVEVGHWWGLALTVPAAGFLVRLFMIQHDSGHGAFFRSRRANAWLGRVIGVLTLTPYDYWRRTHAVHHATAGNLDRRGMGDVPTFTVREYLALPWWRRLGYRLFRHPAVMFGLGPIYAFGVQYRLPLGLMHTGLQPWVSTIGTNLAIVVVVAGMIWFVGVVPFVIVHLPIVFMAATVGVWLFFVQHQFEETYWARDREWRFDHAALQGSSHYALPPVLRWFTANIGIHNVHHLASRIPFYRLPQVLADYPELYGAGRISLRDSLRCARIALWDEDRKQAVPFDAIGGGAATSRHAVEGGELLYERNS